MLAGALVYFSFFVPHDEVFDAGQAVNDPGRATLDILKEIMSLVLTLTTTMLGAAGILIVKGREWVDGWSRLESFFIMLVFLCGIASYFGVYTCQVSILSMVNIGVLNPLEAGLLWSLRLQYFGLIVGAFFLGLAFTLMIERARRPKHARTKPTPVRDG